MTKIEKIVLEEIKNWSFDIKEDEDLFDFEFRQLTQAKKKIKEWYKLLNGFEEFKRTL